MTDASAPATGALGLPLRRVRLDGVSVAYVEAGAGEPVLLLHGYPQSHWTWRHQIDALARTHRVLAPDWPGWGVSERSLALRSSYDEEVARLGRLLDLLGLETTNLIAHDYGAHIGVGFAVRHPERVKRLALLNSRTHDTFPPLPWLLFATIGLIARTPGLRALLARAPLGAIFRRSMAAYVRRGCFDDEQLDRYLDWSRTLEGRRWFLRFHADYRMRSPRDVAARLGELRCPVAVVWGDTDPFNPISIARDLASRIPECVLTRVRGADHYVMEERPAEVTAALSELLDRRP